MRNVQHKAGKLASVSQAHLVTPGGGGGGGGAFTSSEQQPAILILQTSGRIHGNS